MRQISLDLMTERLPRSQPAVVPSHDSELPIKKKSCRREQTPAVQLH